MNLQSHGKTRKGKLAWIARAGELHVLRKGRLSASNFKTKSLKAYCTKPFSEECTLDTLIYSNLPGTSTKSRRLSGLF